MKYTVFSKPSCTFCDQAKALLEARGLEFSVVMLDVGQDKDASVTYISRADLLKLFPNARTMPQIQVQDESGVRAIGGFTELKASLQP